ncbi:MAG: NAD(P)H-hydrate epimerase, partial [Alphaproteobacteria bacterium]|nr:NAD(P)H-hydrate epimerase [Alphaproteobacteria bacterium]
MTELLTAAQMRAIERVEIDSGAVTGLELMERAGQGVVDSIFAHWPELVPSRGPAPVPPKYLKPEEGDPRRAVVLCGPGNNGGDGFVVARLLREAGWAVEVFFYGDAEKLPPDARENYARWGETGEVGALTAEVIARLAGDVVVDALFGTGLRRKVDLPLDRVGAGLRRVAVDLPSGLCSDSGRALGPVLGADLTVTFHAMKRCHVLSEGPRASGHVVCVDIGLPVTDAAAVDVRRLGAPEALGKGEGHKYDFGHALILSGGVGRGGAARMAERGALRIGAGAVTLGCPPAALIENAAQLNAVMLRKVKDADALAGVLEDKRINALCLGPGMGTGPREAALVAAALGSGRRVVLDADALTVLSKDAALFGQLHADCVLTPHAGEFARLFPDIAE